MALQNQHASIAAVPIRARVQESVMSKLLAFLIKTSLVVALFAYLILRALKGSAFSELNLDSLLPGYLFLGFLFNLAATIVTIIRWRYLVQALDVPLSFSDAMKFGFIGFMFNLSPVGIVGGDAVKVYLLARKTNTPVDRATASVIVDRVLGLYAMFVLGLIVVFATGFHHRTEPLALFATRGLVALAIATTIFLALVVAPSSRKNRRLRLAATIPFVGEIMKKLTAATMIYRERKKVLLLSFAATFFVHSGFAVSLYCFAKGLFQHAPSLVDHLILYCVGNVGSIVPLSAGPLEFFLDELYPLFEIAGRDSFVAGHGTAIGVAYRLATVGVAVVGVAYYFFARSDVREALSAADEPQSIDASSAE